MRHVFATLFFGVLLVTGACDCGGSTNGGGDGGVNGNTTGDGSVNGNTNGDGGANGNTTADGGGNGNTTADGGGNGNTTGDGGSSNGNTTGDGGVTCTPSPASAVCPGKCGFVSDDCVSVINCSDPVNGGAVCDPLTQQCIGGTCTTVTVDAGVCVPTVTCQTLGHTCGMDVDDCGQPLDCTVGNTPCTAGQACVPDAVDGHLSCVSGMQSCVGSLCDDVPTNCAVGSPSRLSGTVVTPGINPSGDGVTILNRIPVPNAVVYIPADPATPLPDIFEGVDPANPLSCGRCADEVFVAAGQSVLAAGITDYKGEFTLTGRIPVGIAFNLVVKVGKWRRVVQVPANVSAACTTVALGTQYTRLNASTADGLAGTHLPHIAVGTGEVDEMECVLRNAGISDAEFTNPSGAGRIHLYRMDGARAGVCSGNTTWGGVAHACSDSRVDTNYNGTYGAGTLIPNYGCVSARAGCSWTDQSSGAANLYGSLATLENYDMVVWDCEGNEVQHDADEPKIVQYVDNGGRMFASHFAYTWIEDNGTLAASANWHTPKAFDGDTALVSMPTGPTQRAGANAVKSPLFRDWMDWLGALTGSTANQLDNPAIPSFTMFDPRDQAGPVVGASTDEWVHRTTNSGNCNTTTDRNGNIIQCASDVDCTDANDYCRIYRCSNDANRSCRMNSNCQNGGTCTTTAYRAGYCSNDTARRCNQTSDCQNGGTCSTVAVQQLSFNTPYGANPASACGRVAYTGFHVALTDNNDPTDYFPNVCLDDGNPALTSQEEALLFMLFDLNACVSAGDPVTPPSCTADTVADVCPNPNDACGFVSDGCSGVLDCGGCAPGYYCAVNACRPIPICTPQTCNTLGYNCGQFPDGCGGIADNASGLDNGCGMCVPGESCGPNGQCTVGGCTPIDMVSACNGAICDTVSDGCGGIYTCGMCAPTEECIGGQCYVIE